MLFVIRLNGCNKVLATRAATTAAYMRIFLLKILLVCASVIALWNRNGILRSIR